MSFSSQNQTTNETPQTSNTSQPPQAPPLQVGRLLLPFQLLLDTGGLATLSDIAPNLRILTREWESLHEAGQLMKILAEYQASDEFQAFQARIIAVMDVLYGCLRTANTVQDVRTGLDLAYGNWRTIKREERNIRHGLSLARQGKEGAMGTRGERDTSLQGAAQRKQCNSSRELEFGRSGGPRVEHDHANHSSSEAEVFIAERLTLTRVANPVPLVQTAQSPPPTAGKTAPRSSVIDSPSSQSIISKFHRDRVRLFPKASSFISMIPAAARQDLGMIEGLMTNACFQARVERQLSSGDLEKAPGLESYYPDRRRARH